MTVSVLGIRHHGPGSARSVLAELERLRPEVVLVEGPPEASPLLGLAADPAMHPPVALLVHVADQPRRAAFWPFAAFSPEWVAIRWALANGAEVRFADLPAGQLLDDDPARAEPHEAPEPGDGSGAEALRGDPIDELARAAGDEDGERFWDRLVESRRDPADLFAAVLEAMTALREARPEEDRLTLLREAAMRQELRSVVRSGRDPIAFVCGAWHAPALVTPVTAAADARLLKELGRPPKVTAAWVPWTYERLAVESGYGAGVRSPGWYEHLWSGSEPIVVSWMARVAQVFRAEGLDASSAQLIDATRLAESLAAMRGRAVPSLAELGEAIRACLAGGSDLPLTLVRERLIVGRVMGETPPDAPSAPLVADLEREGRRLRMRPEPAVRTLDLDLRGDTDRARSVLLHRLRLLGVAWGELAPATGRTSTFHEVWTLAWRPEMVVELVAASALGTTIGAAAETRAIEVAAASTTLPALTGLVEAVLLADLGDAVDAVVARIGAVAAVAADVPQLMDALPPLARVLRYGNVRNTDTSAVGRVVDGLVERICVGLVAAAGSLDDAAAEAFGRSVTEVQSAIALLDDPEDRASWRAALVRLVDRDDVHGLVVGRATRLLLDEGVLGADEVTVRMRHALSTGAEPAAGAAWVEGFLRDSGTILLHDADLFAAIDGWVADMPIDAFDAVLPLLRRTVATFTPPERRAIGERVRRGPSESSGGAADALDPTRADLVMPILARILAGRLETPA